jgi:hypothetical protein
VGEPHCLLARSLARSQGLDSETPILKLEDGSTYTGARRCACLSLRGGLTRARLAWPGTWVEVLGTCLVFESTADEGADGQSGVRHSGHSEVKLVFRRSHKQ